MTGSIYSIAGSRDAELALRYYNDNEFDSVTPCWIT